MVLFDMLGMVRFLLMCYSKFVLKTHRTVTQMFDFKIVVTLKSGQRTLKVIESGTIR